MAKIKDIHLKLNRRNFETTAIIPIIKAEEIKTLINSEDLSTLTEGDDNPYFFAQAIAFPVEGNGDVYDREFFESFLAKNSERPFPGDKYGHSVSWYSRQATHFYQIGGEIRGNVAYFKFYVPPETDSEKNTSFIKEIKTNGIDLSLVSRVSYRYNEKDEKYYILSSEGGERNDAVGFGYGSMDQVVINKKNKDNEEGLGMDEILKKLNALISNGDLTVKGLVEKLNKSDLLKTEKEVEDLKVLNSLLEVLGDKPIEKANSLTKKVEEDANLVRNATLETAFGKEGAVREIGEALLANKDATNENIETVKKNAAFIAVAGKSADENSEINKIKINAQENNNDPEVLSI